MGGLTRIYLAPETDRHYDTRLAFSTALAVAAPLAVGMTTGGIAQAAIAALGAWFMVLAMPPRQCRTRAVLLLWRTAILLCHLPVWGTVLAAAVPGGVARPFRQFNYGYWPIFGTPALLLMAGLTSPLTVSDSAYRLVNNLLGALLTALAVTALWPHPAQRPRAATC